MSSSIQDPGRSMLKLAQFKLLSSGVKKIDRKYIGLILQELDPNFKVSSTEEYGKHLLGDSLLHIAYEQESVDALDILIRKGADLNVKGKKGNTVLHMAFYYFIRNGERCRWNIFQDDFYRHSKKSQFITSILSALVEYKNIENPSDPGGLTYFHVACATNNIGAIVFFLKNGVCVDQIVTRVILKQDFTGYTGLHFAAHFGCLRVIEILLEHGANGNLKDAKERSPLYIALERNIAMIDSAEKVYSIEDIEGNEQVIQLLIDRNCIGNFPYLYIASSLQCTTKLKNCLTQTVDMNQCIGMDSHNWPGYTALHFAAHVNVDTVKLLMKHGADIEAKNANGLTPFDMCIKRYKAEDISDLICLVSKWQSIVLSDRKTKLTDLLLAFEDSDKIQDFLQKSDDNIKLFVPLDSPLWPGFTILHIAVLLSERKKCKFDYKCEHIAYFEPDLNVITVILKQGADVTIKDTRNWTPVHLAHRLRRKKVLNLLLLHHHRMQNPVDDDNLSHLHIACAAKHQDFVERILHNDVDVNIPYKGKTHYDSVFPGATPLHIAFFAYDEIIARLLLKHGADPHAYDACTFTPVHFSMYDECSLELSNRLFSSPDLSDRLVVDTGLSYLHIACDVGNLEATRRLLDLGVNVNQVMSDKEDSDCTEIWDFGSRDGSTPLHIGLRSFCCSGDVVRLLMIDRGADVLARDKQGESPLELILKFERGESVKILVEALRRDVELRRRVEVETGVTLLHVACLLLDDDDLVEELLKDGADVGAKIPEDKRIWAGLTPLHLAYDKLCSMGYHSTPIVTRVSLLLKAHKNFHVNPTNVAGISHFHIACHMLDVEVVEEFLKHGVDVNATIDCFYDDDIAGCSPLLLATRTTNWRDRDSSAKLKIVDLLINHGAQVNVEDIDGNTPAHYTASSCSKDENYLQILADSRADVNKRNVRGKTPLELLIDKNDLKLKHIRYFIACGCIFNEFTLDTEEGYIALANFMLSQENMKDLLEETFAKYPESMKRDWMNRNAVHNLVSTEFYETNEKELAALVDIMMRFDCDVDDQDNLGRTALHLAARFRNNIGTETMLLVGADFSITDKDGKPPFAYIFQRCLCKRSVDENEYHEESKHYKIHDTFMIYVRKLYTSKIGVDELNRALYGTNEFIFDPEISHEILQGFSWEFEQIVQVKIKPYSIRLEDFTSRANAVLDYPRMSEAKRDDIDEFFKRTKHVIRKRCPNSAGIFQLQYRKAVFRRKMMGAAKDSLLVLMKFQVPDICSDIILRFLENYELRKLIASTTCFERRSVDEDGHGVFESK